MQFTTQGKITRVFPKVTGTTSGGKTWSKQEYLMETIEEKPQQIFFQVFGDQKQATVNAQVQEVVKVTFTVNCREYNGRYFTNLEADAIEHADGAATVKNTLSNAGAGPASFEPADDTSDLPF